MDKSVMYYDGLILVIGNKGKKNNLQFIIDLLLFLFVISLHILILTLTISNTNYIYISYSIKYKMVNFDAFVKIVKN